MSGLSAAGRRRLWQLLLVALVVALGYPVLLAASTEAGLALGLERDVNAQRELIRALNYAGDHDRAVAFRSDVGMPTLAALDPSALDRLLRGLPPLPTAKAAAAASAPTPAKPGSATAPRGGTTAGRPASTGGGVATAAGPGGTPTGSSPGGPPPQGGGAPLPSGGGGNPPPGGGGNPPPGGGGPPPAPCTPPPSGSSKVHFSVTSPNGKVSGAVVEISYNGCPVTAGSTNGGGQYQYGGLAAGATYSYLVSAPGYRAASGSFIAPTKLDVNLAPLP